MLTAASLCFCKTALLHPFGSKHSTSALPPSQGDRYYSAYSIYSIYNIYSIYSIYNHYNHYPCYPCYPSFPCYRRAFQADAFPITLFRLTPFRFFRADATKNREPSDLTPDYSFQTKAFPITLFRQKPFQLSF